MNTISIMQPYLFPYVGYFQLIDACDYFVFYDDVQYIQRGWINRNRILLKEEPFYITVPVHKKMSRVNICDCLLSMESDREKRKTLKTIARAYKSAPFFSKVYPLIEAVFREEDVYISVMAEKSVLCVLDYLEITTKTLRSSTIDVDKTLRGEDRIIEIVRKLGGDRYVNAIGGIELYSPERFKHFGIELNFLKSNAPPYKQYGGSFVPDLSIIDVLMFNSVNETVRMLKQYELL